MCMKVWLSHLSVGILSNMNKVIFFVLINDVSVNESDTVFGDCQNNSKKSTVFAVEPL